MDDTGENRIMTNFAELLRFELKKIFLSRITILSLAVSTGMLLGIALINYMAVSPYDRGVYEMEAALEGRTLDDALLAELAEEAEEAGGLSQIGPESPYYHLAGYISRMQGTYLTIGNGTESGTGNKELTAESVYRMREELLDYIYDYFRLSDADKQWWKEKEDTIEKPFVWQANFGIYSMKSTFGAAMNLFCMIAAVCLAGVYAGERSHGTDSFVLSTKEGKRSLWLVKFAAGEIFALAAGTLLLIDLLSGLPCDRGAGHAFFGAVHEQYGGSRHYLCGISGGSVPLDTAGTGTAVTAALSDAGAGTYQFQYGRSPAATSSWLGVDATAECGGVLFSIIGRSGCSCAEPLQKDGNQVNLLGLW